MKKHKALQLSLLLILGVSGCSTGPTIFERNDPYSAHKPGSDAWWAEKALLPPGVRQKCWKGKNWPTRPRSTQERQQFSHTYHSEHYWPLPYVCQDRQYMKDVYEAHSLAGWTEQTTLYNRFFDPQTEELTRAGELHLDWILHVAPPKRRTVYVQSSYDAGKDDVRLASVNTYISTSGGGSSAPVVIRDAQEVSRSAKEVGIISEMYNTSIPSPRLGSGGSGGGGGGGGMSAGGEE